MENTAQLVPLRARAKEDLYGDTYPESWYAVMPSRSLKRGKLLPFEAFGQKWVAVRTESGAVQVLSRFCPHMGAALHTGFVKGERVVCPFHRWEYEEGVCKSIPYQQGGKIPPGARLQKLPVREHVGFLWIYNGSSPSHELPDLPEASDSKFGWIAKSKLFDMHPLLVLENGCDPQHFKYIHGVNFTKYQIEMHKDEPHGLGFTMHKTVRGWFNYEYQISTTIEYVGASIIYGTNSFFGRKFARFIAAPLPLGGKRMQYTLIALPRRLPIPGLGAMLNYFFSRTLWFGALQDYGPVWSQMNTDAGGVMVEEDALQLKFRRYYRAHLPAQREQAAP